MEFPLLKFLKRLLLIVVVVIPVISLSVANRQNVKLILDPFSRDDPALFFEYPLFVYLFLSLFAGILIGGIGSWLAQSKWRQSAKERAREAREWRNKANTVTRQLEANSQTQITSASINS